MKSLRRPAIEVLEARTLLDADLAIFKTDEPDPVDAGENLTYTVTVRNLGQSDATGVVVTDELPPGVSFVSAISSQGLCSEDGGVVTCDINTIGGGGVVSETGSGAVIIDGGDRDDHGFVEAGDDGEFGTEDDVNFDGWKFIEQMVGFALAGARNGAANDILAVGVSNDARDAIFSAAVVLGADPPTVVTGEAISTVAFTDFKLLYVPTCCGNTFGGISQEDLDVLALRKADIQAFVNSGGSLVALEESSADEPFSWLELPLPFTTSFSSNDVQRQTQALRDAGLLITDQELCNGTPLHQTFTGPPGFNGLVPFVFNVGEDGSSGDDGNCGTEDDENPSTADDEIVTLGLASGSAGIGGSATITIIVTVPPETLNGTVLTNRAMVTSATEDSNLENNDATEQTTVAGGVELTLDIVAHSFTSGGPGQLGQLRIDYEILDSVVPAFAFGFLSSTDALADGGDLEVGPRINVTDLADRTVGPHSISFDGFPYAALLADLGVPFVLTVADIALAVFETDETNNDTNFVGVFHHPSSAAPLVIRGRDDTDRNTGDDPADDLLFRIVGGKGGFDVEISGSFGIVQVPAEDVSEIRVLGLGGDDRIDGACTVSQPLLARGGTGNDVISSTQGGGDLRGEMGHDVLKSCGGNDRLDGDSGRDSVDFFAALAGVIVDLPAGTATGDGVDLLINIENVFGSTHSDHIIGDQADNFLSGNSGADTIFGGPGRDTVDGGRDDDELHGDNGIADQGDSDHMHGADGNDQVIGDGGSDTIFGGIGNDFLCGHFGDDSMSGEAGDDTMVGDQGDDHLSGGANDDLVMGGDGMDAVFGDDGDDVLSGGRGRDLIDAGEGSDIIFGNRRQDTIVLNRRRRRGDRVLPE